MTVKTSFIAAFILFFSLISGCRQKIPFNVEHVQPEELHGFYPKTFEKIEWEMKEAAQSRFIPSASLTIHREGEEVYTVNFGTTLPGLYGEPVSSSTFFDVASLAKPMAGVPMALMALDHSCIDDDELANFNALLNHTTGWKDGEAQERNPAAKGSYHYANLNYYLLQKRLLDCVEYPYPELIQTFWEPMGLQFTTFDPPDGSPIAYSGYNAQQDPLLGEPYDPLAARLRSEGQLPIAHSGLFTTSSDVARFGSQLLNSDQPDIRDLRKLLLGKPTFLKHADRAGSIWVTPGGMLAPDKAPFAFAGSIPGRFCLSTGYTGCLLWIDTKTNTSVAFLTNAAASNNREKWDHLAGRLTTIIINGTVRGYSAQDF